jgi:hypothetical protein
MLMHHAQNDPALVDTGGSAAGGGRDLALERRQRGGALLRSTSTRRSARRYTCYAPLGQYRCNRQRVQAHDNVRKCGHCSALHALCNCDALERRQPGRSSIVSIAAGDRAHVTSRSPDARTARRAGASGLAVAQVRPQLCEYFSRYPHFTAERAGCGRSHAVRESNGDVLRTATFVELSRAPTAEASVKPTAASPAP